MKAKTHLDEANVDMLGEGIQDAFMQSRPWRLVVLGFVEGDRVSAFHALYERVHRNLEEGRSGGSTEKIHKNHGESP
jgi:hypothetical protein